MIRLDEHRQILAKVEAAWREGRRLLEAQPSEWRAILADPGFRAEHTNKQATARRARPTA